MIFFSYSTKTIFIIVTALVAESLSCHGHNQRFSTTTKATPISSTSTTVNDGSGGLDPRAGAAAGTTTRTVADSETTVFKFGKVR